MSIQKEHNTIPQQIMLREQSSYNATIKNTTKTIKDNMLLMYYGAQRIVQSLCGKWK